jgi:hypothetical protein
MDLGTVPGRISVNPTGGLWTSSPQDIDVSSSAATTIYYRMVNTYDGSTPSTPEDPTPSSNNGSISGPSGIFELYASAGQYKKSKIKFVGCNSQGCGPVSGTRYYVMDLKPGMVSVNPTGGLWTSSPQNLEVNSTGATTI